MRWVRPIFVMPANSSSLSCSASRSAVTEGSSRWTISSTTAMCMAVGNVSFDDCDMLTWSLGWTGDLEPMAPPPSSMARLEMTSLAFMLVWVPLPVCQMRRGKWSSRAPLATSPAACSMRPARESSSLPRSRFTEADAPFRIPNARTKGLGIVSEPMSKWWSDRCVWAPQYRSAGTSTSPMLSLSIRVLVTAASLGPGPRAFSLGRVCPQVDAGVGGRADRPRAHGPGGWSSGHAPGGLLKLGSDVHDPWDQSPAAGVSPKTAVMSVSSASP